MSPLFYTFFFLNIGLFFSYIPLDLSNEENIEIIKINNFVDTVEKDINSYQECEINISGLSTEGTKAIIYSNNEHNAMKITITHFAEMGNTQQDIYLQNEEIRYIQRLENFYNMPIYLENSRIESFSTISFYFKNREIIKIFKEEREVLFQSKEYKQETKKIIQELESINLKKIGSCE